MSDLAARIDSLFPWMVSTLEDLVRIPSISFIEDHADDVRRSAEAVAGLLAEAGGTGVRLLEIEGSHPAVYGEFAGPEGAPTVLLYAHHDVQPAGPGWGADPFEPRIDDGRLYGRGSGDDKAGILMHLGAIKAFDGDLPVNVKCFVEGEEEIGSEHLPDFLEAYGDLLEADVIVIGDSGNWRVGVPTLTTSLRGLVDCVVEVRTLKNAVHSGMFGGVYPDALMGMSRLLSTLHDDEGNVAVEGLVSFDSPGLDLTEAELDAAAGVVAGVQKVGTGNLTTRMWSKPAISILAIDAPRIRDSVNALVPSARAHVSMRLAPGQDPEAAMDALVGHLESNAPWAAQVTVERGASGEAFALETNGPAYDAWREAFGEAFATESVETGVGGSIPFVAAFNAAMPDAEILLTGVIDPTSAMHGPNESVELEDLRKSALAEALALATLGGA
jgi:acetylornithine deacetylase/succinyl-diaminopimelate desuccinylase-like protein